MKYFRYLLRLLSFSFLFFFLSSRVVAQFQLDEDLLKIEAGVWFGPVAIFPGTILANVLNTSLGGGLFFRTNIPSDALRAELGVSFSYYTSDGDTTLISVPGYIAGSYSLPIELPLLLQIKLGIGVNYFENWPERGSAFHPAIFSGFELSFPAGKLVNIGLRIDYYFVIERYLSVPDENPDFILYDGHFINIGLMLSFNFNAN